MALLRFALFKNHLGGQAPVKSVEFWAAMQVAMIGGFITSYPMNWWLIESRMKERMSSACLILHRRIEKKIGASSRATGPAVRS